MRPTTSIALALTLLTTTSTATTLPSQQQHPLTPPKPTHPKPLLDLHRDLVEIESISGNENAVGKYLVSYLQALGLTVEVQPVVSAASASAVPDSAGEETFAPWRVHTAGNDIFEDDATRFNIYAYPGKQRKPHTLLTTHIDTVPPYIPYSITHPSSEDTTTSTTNNKTLISGRGSVDAKGALAAMLTAYSNLHHHHHAHLQSTTSTKPSPPALALLLVVGEEVGGDGMRSATTALNTTFPAVIFGEPTEGALACGHKGYLGARLNVTGKAAHSGYPWLGVSANELLLAALGAMLKADLPASEKYGRSTVNIGRMEGGLAGNVVAQHAEAAVTVRLAGGTPAAARLILAAEVEKATAPLLDKGGSVDVVFTAHGSYGPVDIDCDIEGFEKVTVNYGTDIPNMRGGWGKGYLYGPGSILVAHGEREGLTVGDLERAVRDYERIVWATLED